MLYTVDAGISFWAFGAYISSTANHLNQQFELVEPLIFVKSHNGNGGPGIHDSFHIMSFKKFC